MEEGRVFSKRLFLAIVIVTAIVSMHTMTAYGCLCSIEHPQQKFCNAEFVIIGRVEHIDWITIPIIVPTGEPLTSTEPMLEIPFWEANETVIINGGHQNVYLASQLTANGDTLEGPANDADIEDVITTGYVTNLDPELEINPEPETDAEIAPEPEIEPETEPGTVPETETELDAEPEAEPEAEAESQTEPPVDNGQHVPRRPIQVPRRPIAREPINYNVIYHILVDKIYKNSERVNLVKDEVIMMLAPPPQRYFPMCSHQSLRNNRLYLFSVQNSDMMSSCDWVAEYRSLSKIQKQGLKSVYNRACNGCEINLSQGGMWQNNPDLNDQHTCIAEMEPTMGFTFPDYMISDCYAVYSHCTVKKNGSCKWFSSKHYKACKKSTAPAKKPKKGKKSQKSKK